METFETIKAIINAEEPSLNPYLDVAIQKVNKKERLWNFISIEKVLEFIRDGGKIMTMKEWDNISQMDVYDAKEKWEHLQEMLEKELNRWVCQ